MSYMFIQIAPIQNYSYDFAQHVEAERQKHRPAAAQRHDTTVLNKTRILSCASKNNKQSLI